MTAYNPNETTKNPSHVDAWFDEMVASLRYDQAMMEIDALEENTKEVYNTMMNGNIQAMSDLSRQLSSSFFVTRIVDSYFKELMKVPSKPKKIALELSHSKVLVWAEINEDDEVMEDALILTEAKINSHFSQFGFYISSTIVEDCDGLNIPEHYKSVEIA